MIVSMPWTEMGRFMPTWVIIDYPFSHRRLTLRSCILHTLFIYKMAMAVCSSTILAKRQTSAKAVFDSNGFMKTFGLYLWEGFRYFF